jgi:hypothetical protein
VAHEPPLKFVSWLEAWKGNVPVLGVYRHQAVGANLIAVFLTQTYNSSWHLGIYWILLKLN